MISFEFNRRSVEGLVHKLDGRLHDVKIPRCINGVMTATLQLDKDFDRKDIRTHGEKTSITEGQFIIENKDGTYGVSDYPILEGPYLGRRDVSIKMNQSSQLLNIIAEDLRNLDADTIENIEYLNDEFKDDSKRITIVINIE